jgi:hypothetical protein
VPGPKAHHFGLVTKTHRVAHHLRLAWTSGPVLSFTESRGPNSTPRRRHPVPRCQPPRRPSLSRRLLPLFGGPPHVSFFPNGIVRTARDRQLVGEATSVTALPGSVATPGV